MTRRLRILFLGTSDFALHTLKALARGPDEIVAVVTRPDRPAGRGRRLRPPPVKIAAEQLGLPVLQPERVSRPEAIEVLRSLSPDLLCVAAFGEILSEAVLSLGPLGAINLHASLLPRYRGAAPIQRAILAGDRETGVTVQWMARELDAGDIILQRSLEIGENEDFGSLCERLADLGAAASMAAVDLIRSGSAPRVPQGLTGVSWAAAIKPDEAAIDWNRPAAEIVRQIRAFAPRPGARTLHGGELLKILAARAEPSGADRGVPGAISECTHEGFCAEAAEGRVMVLRVQPAGGRPMSAADYARGRRLTRGEKLETPVTAQGP